MGESSGTWAAESEGRAVRPKISVVTLTNGTRPTMLARAFRCVAASTYPNIEHIVFDAAPYAGRTIGYIRNIANATTHGELIAHADDDDWSHPLRLEEQMALLEANSWACVGYLELLFWDTRWHSKPELRSAQAPLPGEAWIYRNYGSGLSVGASFLYRRHLWEACPFGDHPHEDRRWWSENRRVNQNSLATSAVFSPNPRMVCGIHGGNTEAYDRAVMLKGSQVWRRAPAWDKYCALVMTT